MRLGWAKDIPRCIFSFTTSNYFCCGTTYRRAETYFVLVLCIHMDIDSGIVITSDELMCKYCNSRDDLANRQQWERRGVRTSVKCENTSYKTIDNRIHITMENHISHLEKEPLWLCIQWVGEIQLSV